MNENKLPWATIQDEYGNVGIANAEGEYVVEEIATKAVGQCSHGVFHDSDPSDPDLIVKAVNSHDALVAVRDAAKAYYNFTRSPEPQGFNNQYNMRAIRVGEALFAALEAAK